MNYVCWAAMYEGATDRAYFNVLIPRIIEWMALEHGIGLTEVAQSPVAIFPRRSPNEFAALACSASAGFNICFIHGDTGGRALEAQIEARTSSYCEAMSNVCGWPTPRCVVLAPRKETEAWVLSDPDALAEALGYRNASTLDGVPENAKQAETLIDPKATLQNVIARALKGRRSINIDHIMPAIAVRQRPELLSGSKSFCAFVEQVKIALRDLRVIA